MDFKILFSFTFVISCITSAFCIESMVGKNADNKNTSCKVRKHSKIENDQFNVANRFSSTSSYEDLKTSTSNTTFKEETTSTTIDTIKISTNIPLTNTSPTSCTCGIFLDSQFVKGYSYPTKGPPVISNTLEHSFSCNTRGQKQCQTKCLQQIVQHLPNSASILCASLDHDIHKEKAFLFVRNCSNKWHNTNLAAGREYCCKNGLPYNCPKKSLKKF